MRLLLAMVVCAGCGFRVGAGTPGPDDGRIDSPGDIGRDVGGDDAPTDAPVDGPIVSGTMCPMKWANHTVTLSAPVPLVAQNTTGYDRDPFLTKDGLKLYFNSDITGNDEIYVASRAAAAGPFGVATLVSELDSTSTSEGKLSLTDDGKQAVFASNRTNSATDDIDLWVATRSAVTNPFSGITRGVFLPSIDDTGAQQDPAVTGDGKHVYYSGGSPQAVLEISRADMTSDFGAPVTLFASGFGDADPAISGDQKLILFTSARSGGPGATDIWYATRNAAGDVFGSPVLVPTINDASFDGDPELSTDECTVYFSSSRTNSQFDLYYSVVL